MGVLVLIKCNSINSINRSSSVVHVQSGMINTVLTIIAFAAMLDYIAVSVSSPKRVYSTSRRHTEEKIIEESGEGFRGRGYCGENGRLSDGNSNSSKQQQQQQRAKMHKKKQNQISSGQTERRANN